MPAWTISRRRGLQALLFAVLTTSLAVANISGAPAFASAPDEGSAWVDRALAALSREDCRSALNVAQQRLSTAPQDYQANRVAATAIDCENTLHARSYIRSRLHFGKYRPIDLELWERALNASARIDPSSEYRALALCKLDMLSQRRDTALTDCERAKAVGRIGRFAFQATFSLAQAELDERQLDKAKATFLEAASIAQREGNQRDHQSAIEHASFVNAQISRVPTVADAIEAEAVQEEMMRDLLIRQNEEYWNRR